MTYHKGDFLITVPNGTSKKVSGWLNDKEDIGFYKLCRPSGTTIKWVATDTASGCRITTAATRKACMEWCELNIDLINYQRSKKQYQIYKKFMEDSKE